MAAAARLFLSCLFNPAGFGAETWAEDQQRGGARLFQAGKFRRACEGLRPSLSKGGKWAAKGQVHTRKVVPAGARNPLPPCGTLGMLAVASWVPGCLHCLLALWLLFTVRGLEPGGFTPSSSATQELLCQPGLGIGTPSTFPAFLLPSFQSNRNLPLKPVLCHRSREPPLGE